MPDVSARPRVRASHTADRAVVATAFAGYSQRGPRARCPPDTRATLLVGRRRYSRRVRARRGWPLLLVVAGLLAGALAIVAEPTLYRAETTIVVERGGKPAAT